MARHVPRLSHYYELYAEYFFIRGNEHSVWFYEDDDEELARQGELFFGPKLDELTE
jgi:hypothetical protein